MMEKCILHLKEDEAKIKCQKIINIYIVYDLESNLDYNPDFTLENCLFGGVKITKNADGDMYNFSETRKKFCFSLHYNGANSYLFVNGTEMIKFKAKDSELTSTTLCLGNISYDFSVSNMKKIGLYGTVYEFSADYGAISVDNTLNIHKYLMKKYNKK